MKKMNKMAMVIGAAALAALVSCGVAELPQEVETLQEEVQYTASGKRLVNLSIPTGGGGAISASRSLTATLDRLGVDYYEVVFYYSSETTYYRTAGVKGRTLKISVPEGNYNNSGDFKAVIFAGTYNEKTLLAVGTITSTVTNGISVENAVIASGTTSVTFTLEALEAEIWAGDSSAFGITETGITTESNDNFYTTQIGSKDYPFFKIPANSNTAAELTITGLPEDDLILGTANPIVSNANVINTEAKVLVDFTIEDSGIQRDEFLTDSNNVVAIKIDTTDNPSDGWAAISFDIPVIAILANDHGDQWHIRSGLNYALDEGGSTGSCILLKVGDGQEITIDSVGL